MKRRGIFTAHCESCSPEGSESFHVDVPPSEIVWDKIDLEGVLFDVKGGPVEIMEAHHFKDGGLGEEGNDHNFFTLRRGKKSIGRFSVRTDGPNTYISGSPERE